MCDSTRTKFGLSAVLVMSLLSAGCDERSPALEQRPSATLPVCDLATPEDAAETALLTLQASHRAASNQDLKSVEAAFNQLRYLIDEPAVRKMVGAMPQYKALLGDDLIKGYIENWLSVVSYYIEDLHLNRISRLSTTPRITVIAVPASGADDDAIFRITCNIDEDESWRVARIEFAPPGTVTSAALETTTDSEIIP